jgi:Zn-dependent protease
LCGDAKHVLRFAAVPTSLFLFQLTAEPAFFFTVVFTVIFSITLHELAHGIVAVKLGDPTPEWQGHLTLNPLVHMPPFSFLLLAVAGIAWGLMPIDPTRLRGKYAEALVAVAGPATNLALALIALTVLGVWGRLDPTVTETDTVYHVAWQPLFVFGMINLVLALFNMIPVPPLDGSRILANFSPEFRNFSGNPANSGIFLMIFLVAFMFAGPFLFTAGRTVAEAYLAPLRGW